MWEVKSTAVPSQIEERVISIASTRTISFLIYFVNPVNHVSLNEHDRLLTNPGKTHHVYRIPQAKADYVDAPTSLIQQRIPTSSHAFIPDSDDDRYGQATISLFPRVKVSWCVCFTQQALRVEVVAISNNHVVPRHSGLTSLDVYLHLLHSSLTLHVNLTSKIHLNMPPIDIPSALFPTPRHASQGK